MLTVAHNEPHKERNQMARKARRKMDAMTRSSFTVHLRLPMDLKEAIEERAKRERRPFTMMTILMLEDALAAYEAKEKEQ